MMALKVLAIREATGDRVGVLEGWGGLYMMELFDLGICGVMPGVGMADLVQQVWNHLKQGREIEAWSLYERLVPHIVFSLQNFEMFASMEKDLLRGAASFRPRAFTCGRPPTRPTNTPGVTDRSSTRESRNLAGSGPTVKAPSPSTASIRFTAAST